MKQLFSVLNKLYDDVISLMLDKILIILLMESDKEIIGHSYINTKQKVAYYGDFTEMGNSKFLTHTIEPLLRGHLQTILEKVTSS